MTQEEWELRIHEVVEDELDQMDAPIREATGKALRRLAKSPIERSKSLTGSLKQARSFRFGTPSGEFRALIRLNREQQIVKVYYIGPREGFYETVRRIFE